MNSVSHALYFIKQYQKRYGVKKVVRVLVHYGYILSKKIIPRQKKNIIEVNGYKMWIIPNDPGISQELQTFKTHEPLSTKLIVQLLKKGMTCLDIGANIGYYVLLESKIVGNDGRVIAVEPSPQNYDCIKKNIELQKLENIKAFNFAAGDTNGNIRFFVNERSNGCKVLLEGEKLPNRPGTVIHVPVRKIDDFLNDEGIEKVDFIRMDVEGYEWNIFQGMKNTVQKSKPIIQLEVHKGPMGNETTTDFFEFFKANGYEVISYHQRDLDLPFIGTLKDIKKFTIDELIEKLNKNLLPNYFNLVLKPLLA